MCMVKLDQFSQKFIAGRSTCIDNGKNGQHVDIEISENTMYDIKKLMRFIKPSWDQHEINIEVRVHMENAKTKHNNRECELLHI